MAFTKIKNATNRVTIGSKHIADDAPTFFIAEIGNNHNGDYFLAKRTIEQAAKSGADAVKLQKRTIDAVFAKELRDRPQTKDQVLGKTYGEYRQALELGFDEYVKLKQVAENLGLIFFATPFDATSVEFLEKVGVPLYKLASFDVTNLPLLEYVAKKKKPMILSTGLSTLEELDEAVETILRHNRELVILHCIGSYPTPDESLNLLSIPFLRERYAPLPVGYSGHERDILPTLSAVALGAKCVERHLTLDRNLPGPDHATVSIEPEEFSAMVQSARRIEKALGTLTKGLYEAEKAVRDKHTKSLVARVPIRAGTALTADMIVCKSPGYGLKPRMLPQVVGKLAKTDIPEDAVITEGHIVWEA